MKKFLSFIIVILVAITIGYSQAPGIFNYQGVARNSVGTVIQNKTISLRLTIHDGSATGTTVYQESRTVTTNPFGLFNIQVGSPGANSVTGAITSVSWALGNKYIQVEIDPSGGSSFINIGAAQLASVPYALNAAGASPIGPAGGSLTANYPNPLIANGAVMQTMIAPGVTLPPNGPAGGSLTGAYPNPLIANGAVTQTMIAPGVTLPPNGPAGGDLTANFPNPTVAKIRGVNVNAVSPTTNYLLGFDGTNWTPSSLAMHPDNYWRLTGSTIYNTNTGNLGIGTTTPASSAKLEINSTNSGILIPRMTTAQRTAIPTAVTGLFVYDTDTNSFWFYSGAGWTSLAVVGATTGWLLAGNSATNPATHFIGTTDNQPLRFKVNNTWAGELNQVTGNSFLGLRAGQSNTSGFNNTAIGNYPLASNTEGRDNTASGNYALFSNTEGNYNTAIGSSSLLLNIEGNGNTAIGIGALLNNNNGNFNTANGGNALLVNSSGSNNTAIGWNALYSNTTGYSNIAIGVDALSLNTSRSNLVAIGDSALFNNAGSSNTAVGSKALFSNTTGSNNTANGARALFSNTTGNNNTANGFRALFSNTAGISNTANGYAALFSNTTGNNNTANGLQALYSNTIGINNTANGYTALFSNTTGSYNTANGYAALFSNTAGISNTANGYAALFSNINGGFNAAHGYHALYSNITGGSNTANGYEALYNNNSGIQNTATGKGALYANTMGNNNTATGEGALDNNITGSNNTAIGTLAGPGISNISNSITVGYNSLTNTNNLALLGNTVTAFCGGYVNWSNFSDGRFKKNIKENVPGLDFIKALRPVTYTVDIHELNRFIYKDKTEEYEKAMAPGIAEKEKIVQTGFIAQEVETAAQKTGYDFDGVVKPKDNSQSHYSLSYASFVVPLVKAVQEQQSIIETLQKQVEAAKAEMPVQIGKQQAIIEKQTVAIQDQNKTIHELIKRIIVLENKLK